MAVFKCKMCGSDLYPEDGARTVVCDLCGSEQTLPTAVDDKKTALFNKANAFRMRKRFDEALKLYAEIQEKYPDEADAHWGKLLCEYGIEYVDDVRTERKIPTCNRTLSISIFDHPEYKSAMAKATTEECEIYKREAAEIDGYQKKILEIASKEAPYDIFICYKEQDGEGKRTKDSQLATKIYENLTKKNYKVFFSRITLKSKVGTEYEPYIYAALQSAKVMLVLATKKEYVEAVWVRNEWSRYLGFMEADGGKSIVPCIKDIDAYDLPEALQDFQAQDMGELDFIENLTRAIDSKFGRATYAPQTAPVYAQPVPAPTVSPQGAATPQTSNVLKNALMRASIALEDGDFAEAERFAEQALNEDATCAEAYYVHLMCELRVKNDAELSVKNFTASVYFKRAMRFADGELLKRLQGLEKEKIRQLKKAEEERIRREKAAEEERLRRQREAEEAARKAAEEEARRKEEKRRRREEEAKRKAEEARRAEEEKRRKEEAERLAKERRMDEKRRAAMKSVKMISAGDTYSVGLRSMGQVLYAGGVMSQDKQRLVDRWRGITAIASGNWHTLGIKRDGTVVAEGSNDFHQCRVGDWKDVVQVAAGYGHSLGLKADGTVVAAGGNTEGQCNVSKWTDIVQVAAGGGTSYGLKKDGTVVSTGVNDYHQRDAVASWTGIVQIAATMGFVVGLHEGGHVLAAGDNYHRQCGVSEWRNVKAVSCGGANVMVLFEDGKVDICGRNWEKYTQSTEKWQNIVAIAAGDGFFLAVRKTGKLAWVGDNSHKQCALREWTLFDNFDRFETEGEAIALREALEREAEEARRREEAERLRREEEERRKKAEEEARLFAIEQEKRRKEELAERARNAALIKPIRERMAKAQGLIASGAYHAAAVTAWGTVLATGDNNHKQCNVSKWTNIIAVDCGWHHTVGLRSDGTVVATGNNEYGQCNVSFWTDIVAVSSGNNHTVGLRRNGSVVATGQNEGGRCSNTASWRNVARIYACDDMTVGVTKDGRLLCTKNRPEENDPEWKDVPYLTCVNNDLIGLGEDGRVLMGAGMKERTIKGLEKISGSPVVALAVGRNCFDFKGISLTLDGKLHVSGINLDAYYSIKEKELQELQDVVAVSAGNSHIAILLGDGTVVFGGDGMKYTQEWILFDSFDTLEQERKTFAERRAKGVCQHCGGELKGLFGKKCVSCGKPKDY